MLTFVTKVKHWWKREPLPPGSPEPCVVECTCGRQVEGVRRPTFQVISCPSCAGRVFILPQSPLPRPLPDRLASPAPGRSRGPHRLLWGAVPAAALVVGLVCWLLLRPGEQPVENLPEPEPPGPHIGLGKQALAQGMFQTAARELERAWQLQARCSLPPAERRRLARLRLQARLLADLLDLPLEDVLRQAMVLPAREWEAIFARRFRGRAVVLDGEVSRSADGTKYLLEYHLFTGGREGRVEINDLDLLRQLPLDQPYRLIVGARLAGVGREPSGAWVIHLEPASGVLLTERDALEAACPALAADGDLGDVLQRQRDWLAAPPR